MEDKKIVSRLEHEVYAGQIGFSRPDVAAELGRKPEVVEAPEDMHHNLIGGRMILRKR